MFNGLVKSVRKLRNIFTVDVYVGNFASREAMVKKITDALDDIDDQCLDMNVTLTLMSINSAVEAITEVKTKGGKFGINITAGIEFQNSFEKLVKLKKDNEKLAQGIFETPIEAKYYLSYVGKVTESIREQLKNNLNKEDIREKTIYLNNIFDMPYVKGNER